MLFIHLYLYRNADIKKLCKKKLAYFVNISQLTYAFVYILNLNWSHQVLLQLRKKLQKKFVYKERDGDCTPIGSMLVVFSSHYSKCFFTFFLVDYFPSTNTFNNHDERIVQDLFFSKKCYFLYNKNYQQLFIS